MSDTSAQEPTMEEILASIRRIISEDDAPQAAASSPEVEAQAPHPAPEPQAPVKASAPAPEEDVLELTDPVDPPSSRPPHFQETLGDLDVFSPSEPAPPPPPARPAASAPVASYADEPLVGSYAAEQTAGHFGALARSVAMPREGRTLEDVVREMLKPMMRDWLDQNLPAIVEARVQAEVERISRRQDY